MRFSSIAFTSICVLVVGLFSAQVPSVVEAQCCSAVPQTRMVQTRRSDCQPNRRGLFRRQWRRSLWTRASQPVGQSLAWATPEASIASSSLVVEKPDCGCGTAVARQSESGSSKVDQTFTRAAPLLCPSVMLGLESGIFVYQMIDCATGQVSNLIYFYPQRVKTGCDGSGGCKTKVKEMDIVDPGSRVVNREFLKEIVAKFRADSAKAERSKSEQPQPVSPPTPDE